MSASDLRRAGVPAPWLAEHALVRAGERRQQLGQCVRQIFGHGATFARELPCEHPRLMMIPKQNVVFFIG